ncbi:MAG: hypothetical protein P4N60_12190 [Verrucomicrobiae bacterium]|nr:hypothetical protein [Verrucomicrobiae bacterium]
MKKIIGIILAAFAVLLYQTAGAVVYKTCEFVGYTTGNLGVAGTGAADGWENSSANVVVTNGSGSLDGTALGLAASAGDKVFISGTTDLKARNDFVPSGTFPATTTDTNIYFSFLYKFNSVTDADGKLLFRVNVGTSGTGTAQYWDMLAKNVAGSIQLGISKPSGPVVYAPTNIAAGQTIFVVVRHHMIVGPQNDTVELWINPPPGSFGAGEGSVPPAAAITGTLTTDGTEVNAGSGPGRFVVCGGANAQFDEFRVTSTWAEATPPYGICVGAGFDSNPTNITQVAEISATLNAKAASAATSPTYQWQVSNNGGTSWTTIAGATLASYTTPNLSLATDNGNQYRAIVYVACNNSYATSSVATVTLTAPVATPAGVVVDDLFNVSFVEPITPVTVNNAAWYTASSTSLDIYHGGSPGAPMTATPASGTSTLWLGYFTPTNTLPVHLAVGNTMKVTMPFTPTGYTAHTNNSSVRIGVFDYADGGIRVSNDDTTVGGSAGSGVNVRGYMLSLDFGPTFTASSPLSLLARTSLNDVNLMGSTASFTSLGSGPSGGGYSNAPAFQAGTQYTLVMNVIRAAVNTVIFSNNITGGGTNWAFSVTETNLAYHRFDAFAIRPNSLETTADSFNIAEFKVEVIAGPSVPNTIAMGTVSRTGSNVSLTWTPTPTGSFTYTVQRKVSLTDALWTTLQTGISTTSYTDTTATATTGFYRVTSP